MSAKLATLDILKIKVYSIKGYDVVISVRDVTKNVFPSELNYIVDVVMWIKFGNSSISMSEVIITSILIGFDKKNNFFFRGVVLVQV